MHYLVKTTWGRKGTRIFQTAFSKLLRRTSIIYSICAPAIKTQQDPNDGNYKKINSKQTRLKRLSWHLLGDNQHASMEDHLLYLFHMIYSFTAKRLKWGNLWSLTAYLTCIADYPDFQKAVSGLHFPTFLSASCSRNRCTEQTEVGSQASSSCWNCWHLLCNVQLFSMIISNQLGIYEHGEPKICTQCKIFC